MDDDFTQLDDPEFLAERRRVRETIEALIVRYQKLNDEFDRRAGIKWASAKLGITVLPRLLAVEVLLAEPEVLGDDVLESCLYILRDRLRGADAH